MHTRRAGSISCRDQVLKFEIHRAHLTRSAGLMVMVWQSARVVLCWVFRYTRGLFFGLTVCCPPLRLAKLAPLAGITEWDSACIGGGAAG